MLVFLSIFFVSTGLAANGVLLSDDFNPATHETNPSWRFYDPYDKSAEIDPGESNLTFDGSNALIHVPAGSVHDLWKSSKNKAPRLLQPVSNTDFAVEAKFETEPRLDAQLQGIVVQQTNKIFLRFDIFSSADKHQLVVAYVNGKTTTTFKSASLAQYPKFHQVIRTGNQWSFRYSVDGVNWTDAISFTQVLTVTEVGFFAGNASDNPEFLSSVDYFVNLNQPLIDADVWLPPPPVIDVWYGSQDANQLNENKGLPQQWLNILGNVFSDADIASLMYQVNDGPMQNLPWGSDGRRLWNEGDFNIEVDAAALNPGVNTVVVVATDENGSVSEKSVSLTFYPDNVWPLPYVANWGTLTDIDGLAQVAQPVDGLWKLTADGIRTRLSGYDRTLAIGDLQWPSDYDVIVPLTLHSAFRGVGVGVGWQGHAGVESPKIEWPLQALAWLRGPFSNPSLEIITYGGLSGWEVVEAKQAISLVKDRTYLLKTHTEPLANGFNRFYVKLWQQNKAEPSAWNLFADVPARQGSVLLVAHRVDVTFGNVQVDYQGDGFPPEISDVKASVDGTAAVITWTTDKPSTSEIVYSSAGDGEQIFTDGALVTSHQVTLNGLEPSTEYSYRVKSADVENRAATEAGLSFVTGTLSGLVSDDFNSGLHSAWYWVDPLGDSVLSSAAGAAEISLPAGSGHDLWKTGVTVPRLLQKSSDENFEIEVKIDSPMALRYQIAGLMAEQDAENLLRFDVYHDGRRLRFFAARLHAKSASIKFRKIIENKFPLYLRVARSGDQWHATYSYDANQWLEGGSFSEVMNVQAVGVFAGNQGDSPPAYSALFDYFIVDGRN